MSFDLEEYMKGYEASKNIEQKQIQNENSFDLDKYMAEYREPIAQTENQVNKSFTDNHPIVSSIPEAGKQFALRTIKSYPEFAKGLNDLTALIGDKTGISPISNFGKNNAEFWENQSNKIQINPEYQGIKGLSSKKTFIPTVLGSVGDQTTNILMSMGGGVGGAKLAAQAGLKGLSKAGIITAGTAIPNLAQEGSYLDKIQAFQQIYGRTPTAEELANIQNAAITEKGINTALETLADKLLFAKLFPQGTVSNGARKVLKNIGEQSLTEGLTEAAQESISIGAEKYLGINEGNNIQRLADSAGIGAITGGLIGGGASAFSQPNNFDIDTQNKNATKSVSAKILQNGKELYNSTKESLNKPDSFDTLKTLSKDGVFNNKKIIEKIAPKTVEKQKVEKEKPKTNIETNKKIALENTENIEKNTAEFASEQAEQHQKSFNASGSFIKDNEGNVYEVLENGYLRNVDTNEHSIGNIDKKYQQYKHNEKELISQKTFEYNPKSKDNADNYTFSKQEAVDAYNNYIKNPTQTNQEIYEDTIGRLQNEYHKLEPQFKAKAETNSKKVAASIKEIAPNIAAKVEAKSEGKHTKDFQKGDIVKNIYTGEISEVLEADKQGMGKLKNVENGNISTPNAHNNAHYKLYTQKETKNANQEDKAVNSAVKNETVENQNNEIEKIAQQYADMLEQGEVREFHRNFAKALINKDATSLKTLIAHGRGFNENSKKMFTKYTGIKLPTTIKGKIETLEKWANGDIIQEDIISDNKQEKSQKNLENSKKIENNENINTLQEGNLNGRNDIRRSEERTKTISERESGRSETNPEHRLDSRADLSGNEVGNGSGASILSIHNRHLEDYVNKEYKNQHELNQSIEKFINEKEHEKYDKLPEEIKSWLRKYTGSGGLEKQGATGKGLLSEYYTPKNIVQKMWDITSQYIDTYEAKILEPSVGIGRFLENAPQNTSFDVVEVNPISAKITEKLYPDATVKIGQFQEQFIENNKPVKNVNPKYDIVIGNPPYGQYSGLYKGLGEGKVHPRLENYFIDRALDSLKENGILTFIVPSSFLKNATTKSKQQIAKKAELIDAYRLPENTFDTTQIGTDIIVLRKKKGINDKNIFDDNWFNQHPEKILGTVEERKSRFGNKTEIYVKGDKNAVESIDTSKKEFTKSKKTPVQKKQITTNSTVKKNLTTKELTLPKKAVVQEQEIVDYEVYKPKNAATQEEIQLFADTKVDGTLPEDKYSPNKNVNQYKNKLYNDFNYLQGDIYEKLDQLENEDISQEQKEIQRKKLEKVLPEPKKINTFEVNPLSDFAQSFDIKIQNPYYREHSYYRTKKIDRELYQYDNKEIDIQSAVLQYISDKSKVSKGDLNGVLRENVKKYLSGKQISIDYTGLPSEKYCNAAQKFERNQRRIQQTSDCRETALKLFNEFIRTNLTEDVKSQIENKYNRTYNNFYNPDYLKLPMLIQDVSANFKGRKLDLREAQIEGINFLNNQGVGLLGFDVGVGKTLTAIISTVQNMKMGRCKRPLILAPQATIPKNWLKEIKELYPNIKINNLGNLGSTVKFDGQIEDNTLTICSYQALENIWWNPETIKDLLNTLYSTTDKSTKNKILYSDKKKDTEREKAKILEDIEKIVGEAQKGNSQKYLFENLGFDHITVDEAHNFKNLFANAKAYNEKGQSYNVQGGKPSTRAVRLFLLTQYILKNNNNRNVYLLSATPFTNKPIEVFSMFSYIAKDSLDAMQCNNVHQFIETFANMKAVDNVNDRNEIVTQDVCTGFKNKDILYRLRDKFMMMRKGKESELKRPIKHTKVVVLQPSKKQSEIIDSIDNLLSSSESKGADTLKRIAKMRTVTLSPDMAEDNINISAEEFINNSPKLKFIIEAVKAQHEYDKYAHQIIYSPRGTEYFPKIKEYFVNHKIFKSEEIAIITGDTKEDTIAEYIDSFNEKNGRLKLIIGSSTINEGVNLNEYSTTLYLPFTDWNPTQHQQVEGRIWRSGNHYKDCRIIVPLLYDSSDPFLNQKLTTKIQRINDLMFTGNENEQFIDPEELDTDAQRLALITNPVKKAQAFVYFEQKKLNSEKLMLEGKIDSVQQIIQNKNNAEENIKYYEKEIEKNKKDISEMEDNIPVPEKDWQYQNAKNNLERNKKYLQKSKDNLKRINQIIKIREYDINGADKPENIQNRIDEINTNLENLKNIKEEKIKEYSVEYEKQRKNSKTIEEHIKEFIEDTHKLYDNNSIDYDIDIPDFLKNLTKNTGFKDIDLESVNELILNNTTIKELSKILPEELKKEVEGFEDYKVLDMNKGENTNNKGAYIARTKTIKLNLKAIGNNPYKFIQTFMHEIQHAKQTRYYRELVKKQSRGEYLTQYELDYMKGYRNSDRLNKIIQKFRNLRSTKRVVEKFDKATKGMTLEQKEAYLASMNNKKERDIILKNAKYFNKYWNLSKEVDARAAGEYYAKDYKNEIQIIERGKGSTESLYGTPGSRDSGTNNRRSLSQYRREQDGKRDEEYFETIEDSNFYKKIKKGIKPSSHDKLYQAQAKSKIRKWYSEIQTDRYDVDFVLHNFIKNTKSLAKKFKVSDKVLRETLPFLRERTELPKNLNRPDIEAFYNSITDTDKKSLIDLADNISNELEKYYKNYQEAKGIIDYETIENHISHIWDLDDRKNSLLTNYFQTSSKFAKQRTIKTLVDGIDGIEINGETIQFKPKTIDYAEILKTSTDSLIKATHDMKLAEEIKQLKAGKNNLIMPADKAPADWKEISHPALAKTVYKGSTEKTPIFMKTPVRVHPSIERILLTVFEQQKTDNAFWKAYDTVGGILKTSQLGLSMFHGVALTESSLGNIGFKQTIKILNPVRMFKEIATGNYSVYKDPIARQAIKDGVKLGTPTDLQRTQIEEFADSLVKTVEKIPNVGKILKLPVKVLNKGIKLNNDILWNYLHTNFKLEAYKINCELIKKSKDNLTEKDRQETAQWVNDSFGGQAWELLGIKKSEIKTANRLFLSPDWQVSTIRQFAGAFISGNTGKVGRRFWIRAMAYSLILYNILNAIHREKDRKEHPEFYKKKMTPFDYTIWANTDKYEPMMHRAVPYIFIGRDKENQALYLRLGKQFREVPEMIAQPVEKFSGKANPLLQMGSQVTYGKSLSDLITQNRNSYLNQDIWNGYGKNAEMHKGTKAIIGRAKTLAKMSMPFIMQNAINEKHNFNPYDFIGQTSKGMTKGKSIKKFQKAFSDLYKNNDKSGGRQIINASRRDGLSEEQIINASKTAKSNFLQPYKNIMNFAMKKYSETGNKKPVQEVLKTMKKDGLSNEERQKILENAYKNYMKNRE